MNLIHPHDLVDIQAQADAQGIRLRTDLIYARADHPLNATFACAIYRAGARMWMHRMLAPVVLDAARAAIADSYVFVLTDCLRTTDAQARMGETPVMRANPHWTLPGPGMLISPPGAGAHPRGMAVDIYLETLAGGTVDMGTALDHFSTDPADNPAARDYAMPPAIAANRKRLEDYMMQAAAAHGVALLPLPSEWWDFRLAPDIYERYAPLADADLPAHMRMCA